MSPAKNKGKGAAQHKGPAQHKPPAAQAAAPAQHKPLDTNDGFPLVTRDRADHHLTEISYIYTFFAHVTHTCTITSMLHFHTQGRLTKRGEFLWKSSSSDVFLPRNPRFSLLRRDDDEEFSAARTPQRHRQQHPSGYHAERPHPHLSNALL